MLVTVAARHRAGAESRGGATMQRSTERILTTHTGSLPRPDALRDLIIAREKDAGLDPAALARATRDAVADAVRQQIAVGIDVVSDGEMGKLGFTNYVKHRLTGFAGEPHPFRARDMMDYPELAARQFSGPGAIATGMPGCTGPITYRDRDSLRADLENLRLAVQDARPVDAFLPAASPGCIVQASHNTYYPTREAYLYALADALQEEYRAIVEAGFVLQVDCPDFGMGRHCEFPDVSLAEYRKNLELHVAALNHGLAGLPEEQIRVHLCWGNYPGPHHRDVELKEIADVVLRCRANAFSVEAANPRHQHEWKVWEAVKLPKGKVLIPGVIDTNTNYVEHPEVVAQRLVRFAGVVGKENMIAGTDCGFGTFTGFGIVAPRVAYAKLASLAEGARLASAALWGG